MSNLIVTDLDGTLVDSYHAVLAAYRHAGVEPPGGWWGRPSHEWPVPPSPQQHAAKNRAYVERYLDKVRPLPLLAKVRDHLANGGRVAVLTAASTMAATAVLQHLRLYQVYSLYIHTGLERSEKLKLLHWYSQADAHGTYYDDDAETVRQARAIPELKEWLLCHVI